jgi:hypothetical protein
MNNISLPESDHFQSSAQLHVSAPVEVRWALILLWLSLALSAGQYVYFLYFALGTLAADSGRGAAIVGLALPFAVYVFGAYLNVKIARRKNWARIAKLVFAAASLAFQAAFSSGLTGFEYLSVGLAPALNFAALYLLFFTSGRLWFRSASPSTAL